MGAKTLWPLSSFPASVASHTLTLFVNIKSGVSDCHASMEHQDGANDEFRSDTGAEQHTVARVSSDDRDQKEDERSNSHENRTETGEANIADGKETRIEESEDETIKQQAGSKTEPRATLIDNNSRSSRKREHVEQNVETLETKPLKPPNSSLEQIQRATWAFQNIEGIEAAQVPLPSSKTSSLMSVQASTETRPPLGTSLEDLELRPEDIPLPSRKKPNPFLNWMAGSAPTKSRNKGRKKQEPTPESHSNAEEVENYRNNVNRLANHFAYFNSVATTETRHGHWISQIVFYDRLEHEQHHSPMRNEPWPNQAYAPSYAEFYGTLRTVHDNCQQRLILVEDLTPSSVDLLGATFDIPPHVFEEHLDRSGYRETRENHKSASAWNARSSAQGYSSVTWYRPVLPLFSLDAKFRAKLIKNRSPQVPCPLEGCEQHNVSLSTTGNIWRHYIDLCPEPGDYHKDSETEYPVGWEERATVWSRDIDGCKFVIILLDPLPVVVGKQGKISAWRREGLIPMGNQWIIKEEGNYKSYRARPSRNREQYVVDWTQQSSLPTHFEGRPSSPPIHHGPNPTFHNPQTTGADVDPAEIPFTATALRRRATTGASNVKSTSPVDRGQDPRAFHDPPLVPPPPPPMPAPSASAMPRARSRSIPSVDQEAVLVRDHGAFVPYDLIKARSSSSARNDATFVTKHMRAYIESLQIPKSTLEEFELFMQVPMKGKEPHYDPFHALFRAIHDDSHSLVDIIRISLQRIRQDTLNIELMQERVTFWRALLHRLNFNLGELDQNLRAFVQFINEPESHTSQAMLPSEKLAEDTRQTLRSCMDLIDRSSGSLLSEMQIVDSQRSIAEAESVSKLTELAFVFIPLSFVASLFSMQVHELGDGVPLYQFVLVAIGFVVVAYAVRLSIRSSHLIEYKKNIFDQIREDTDIRNNKPIPTHKFLGWLASNSRAAISKHTIAFVAISAPAILSFAVIAAMVSPIILLWLRKIDKGFTIVMTVLLLLLDAILVAPILLRTSDKIEFNPQERLREMQQAHRINREKREKAKRRRKRKAGEDPEQVGADSSDSSQKDGQRGKPIRKLQKSDTAVSEAPPRIRIELRGQESRSRYS
ncbi:unnamed protein product [Periconia digitata]|uniref:Uncharacterized protein n=1 Tax=Periconia digitata TaxID=1303443 RepID=A0A9W4UFN8_9PLEO|nr:unnamed protein product [Periconia digitata]